MEETNLDSAAQGSSGLEISTNSKQYLIETSKWGLFFTVLGFIMIGLICLAAIVMIGLSSTVGQSMQLSIMGVAYLIFGVLYIIPVIYMMKFSNNMKKGLEMGTSSEIEEGFKNLKALFRFTGILSIVVIGLYILGILVAVIAGVNAM